jgi:hypothetical protein
MIVAVTRGAPTEPAPPAPLAEPPRAPECQTVVSAWELVSDPLERVGYRDGRRHVFEVVPLGPTGVEVEVGTAHAFLAMRDAAAKACIDLRLESGFRTLEEQRALFRAWRKGVGNKAARPGRSNHQSGRALDISVGSVPGAYEWLAANAASFGFKRTVKNEPWHWEYVDSPIARAVTKRVSRKLTKPAKLVRNATRASQRPGTRGAPVRASGGRVASTRR